LTRLVSSKSLPSFPPVERYARLRLPFSGSLGSGFPTFPTSILSRPSVLCSAATASSPSRIASLFAHSPIPCAFPFVLCPTLGWLADIGGNYPISAGSLGPPVLLIFRNFLTRKLWALPSPRATPMNTCPVLRPRWCPINSPYRLQDCCLPHTPKRRLSPLVAQRLSIRSTTIHISGFNTTACTLVPSSFTHPITEIACGLHFWSAG